MEQYEIMEQSIMKNIQELSELCVDYGITNAYDLMEIIPCYCEILERVKANGGKCVVELDKESEE